MVFGFYGWRWIIAFLRRNFGYPIDINIVTGNRTLLSGQKGEVEPFGQEFCSGTNARGVRPAAGKSRQPGAVYPAFWVLWKAAL